MYIGITERGDAGIDFSWYEKVKKGEVDGAILITKKISNPEFVQKALELHQKGYNIIIHSTVTGWGGTVLEPFVPHFTNSLRTMREMIDYGFPKERMVLRIDPLFPNEKGLRKMQRVMETANLYNLLPIRVRISVLDEYRHVKERIKAQGLSPLYGNRFQANDKELAFVASKLELMHKQYGIRFECCAETKLAELVDNADICIEQGCISEKDLKLLHIEDVPKGENNQNRKGCHCLSCKKELLESKKQCPNECIYCYWK